jgi:hypothetical protein
MTGTVFEARFKHIAQLRRMGADIEVNGNQSTITGVPNLRGLLLMGEDLRACTGLLIAALMADGKSLVGGLDHLDRGHAGFEEKMVRVGARIRRVPAKCEDHVILQSLPWASSRSFWIVTRREARCGLLGKSGQVRPPARHCSVERLCPILVWPKSGDP